MAKDLNGAWLALGVAGAVAAVGAVMAGSGGSRALSGVDDLRRWSGHRNWSDPMSAAVLWWADEDEDAPVFSEDDRDEACEIFRHTFDKGDECDPTVHRFSWGRGCVWPDGRVTKGERVVASCAFQDLA